MSHRALSLLAVCLLAGLAPASASADDAPCYLMGETGQCLDAPVPETRVYETLDETIGDGIAPAGAAREQKHGAIRLTEATYIYAYRYCRYVDNRASRGPGIFIGLGSESEWIGGNGFVKNPPAGADIVKCCIPAEVQICGEKRSLGFQKEGHSQVFTGGLDKRVSVSCIGNATGLVPTADTSWLQSATGQCAAEDGTGEDQSKEREGYHDKAGDGNGVNAGGKT